MPVFLHTASHPTRSPSCGRGSQELATWSCQQKMALRSARFCFNGRGWSRCNGGSPESRGSAVRDAGPTAMARNEEKAMSALNRWTAQKRDIEMQKNLGKSTYMGGIYLLWNIGCCKWRWSLSHPGCFSTLRRYFMLLLSNKGCNSNGTTTFLNLQSGRGIFEDRQYPKFHLLNLTNLAMSQQLLATTCSFDMAKGPQDI